MHGSSEIDFCDLKEGWNVFAGTCGVVVLTVDGGRCKASVLGTFKKVYAFIANHGDPGGAIGGAWARCINLRASHTEPTPAGTHPRPVSS